MEVSADPQNEAIPSGVGMTFSFSNPPIMRVPSIYLKWDVELQTVDSVPPPPHPSRSRGPSLSVSAERYSVISNMEGSHVFTKTDELSCPSSAAAPSLSPHLSPSAFSSSDPSSSSLPPSLSLDPVDEIIPQIRVSKDALLSGEVTLDDILGDLDLFESFQRFTESRHMPASLKMYLEILIFEKTKREEDNRMLFDAIYYRYIDMSALCPLSFAARTIRKIKKYVKPPANATANPSNAHSSAAPSHTEPAHPPPSDASVQVQTTPNDVGSESIPNDVFLPCKEELGLILIWTSIPEYLKSDEFQETKQRILSSYPPEESHAKVANDSDVISNSPPQSHTTDRPLSPVAIVTHIATASAHAKQDIAREGESCGDLSRKRVGRRDEKSGHTKRTMALFHSRPKGLTLSSPFSSLHLSNPHASPNPSPSSPPSSSAQSEIPPEKKKVVILFDEEENDNTAVQTPTPLSSSTLSAPPSSFPPPLPPPRSSLTSSSMASLTPSMPSQEILTLTNLESEADSVHANTHSTESSLRPDPQFGRSFSVRLNKSVGMLPGSSTTFAATTSSRMLSSHRSAVSQTKYLRDDIFQVDGLDSQQDSIVNENATIELIGVPENTEETSVSNNEVEGLESEAADEGTKELQVGDGEGTTQNVTLPPTPLADHPPPPTSKPTSTYMNPFLFPPTYSSSSIPSSTSSNHQVASSLSQESSSLERAQDFLSRPTSLSLFPLLRSFVSPHISTQSIHSANKAKKKTKIVFDEDDDFLSSCSHRVTDLDDFVFINLGDQDHKS
jgi:hypothetical protein